MRSVVAQLTASTTGAVPFPAGSPFPSVFRGFPSGQCTGPTGRAGSISAPFMAQASPLTAPPLTAPSPLHMVSLTGPFTGYA